jgi:WD40 repeat protein
MRILAVLCVVVCGSRQPQATPTPTPRLPIVRTSPPPVVAAPPRPLRVDSTMPPPTTTGSLRFVERRGDTALRLGRVGAVAASRDGMFVAAANADETIAVWDLHVGAALRTIRSKTFINHLAIADDGASLVATGYGWVQMWDLARGALRWEKTFKVEGGEHAEARFSPDGHDLLIRTGPHCVNNMHCTLVDHLEIVDTVDGRSIWDEPSNDSWNHGYAISADLRTIAGVHWTKAAEVIAVLGRDGKPLRDFASGTKADEQTVTEMSANGDRVAVLEHAVLRVYATTGKQLVEMPMTDLDALWPDVLLADDPRYAIVWDNKVLVGIDLAARRELWREPRAACRKNMELLGDAFLVTDGTKCVARRFSDGGELWRRDHDCSRHAIVDGAVIVSRGESALDRIDATTAVTTLALPPASGPLANIDSLEVAADGAQLATSAFDCSLWIWDARTTARRQLVDPPDGLCPKEMKFLRDGHLAVVPRSNVGSVAAAPLATRGPSNPTLFRRYDTWRNAIDATRAVDATGFTRAREIIGDRVIVERGDEYDCPRMAYDLNDRSPPKRLAWPAALTRAIFGGAWIPCQNRPAFITDDGEHRLFVMRATKLELWNVATARVVATHADSHVTRFVLTPDEKSLVVRHEDGTIQLLDAKTLRLVRTLDTAVADQLDLAMSRDSKLIAAMTRDGLVLWRLADGARIATVVLASTIESASAVAFSPDGTLLWMGTSIGNVLEFAVTP